jgi:hypothetical protein
MVQLSSARRPRDRGRPLYVDNCPHRVLGAASDYAEECHVSYDARLDAAFEAVGHLGA